MNQRFGAYGEAVVGGSCSVSVLVEVAAVELCRDSRRASTEVQQAVSSCFKENEAAEARVQDAIRGITDGEANELRRHWGGGIERAERFLARRNG